VAYIGNDLQVAFSTYKNIDDISGSFDGVTTSFALLVNGVAPAPLPLNSNQCLISVGGVVQRPDDTGTEGFRLSGGNIVFSSAPNTAEDFFGVILAGADYVNAGANFPDGTLAAPSITFDQDNDTGYYRSGSGAVSFASNGVAAGTWSSAGVTAPALIPTGSSVPANGVYLPAANTVGVATNGTGRLFVDATGNVGIGTTPDVRLHVADTASGSGTYVAEFENLGTGANTEARLLLRTQAGSDNTDCYIGSLGSSANNSNLTFATEASGTLSEKARIDSSGRLLVGTTSARSRFQISTSFGNITPVHQFEFNSQTYNGLSITHNSGANSYPAALAFGKSRGSSAGSYTAVATGDNLGWLDFYGADGTNMVRAANISVAVDGTPGTNDMPGRLTFSTTADGASSPTERVRISSIGELRVGADSPSGNSYVFVKVNNNTCYIADRLGSDGDLFLFRQAGTQEGSISVSGTTVSYNGAHLSRWSQIPGIDPYNKAVRPEILRGTVMSNLDEMCDWTCPESGECQDNEQLNKTKISDVEGDKNVAGIFQSLGR
jgi:hypothetical protein